MGCRHAMVIVRYAVQFGGEDRPVMGLLGPKGNGFRESISQVSGLYNDSC